MGQRGRDGTRPRRRAGEQGSRRGGGEREAEMGREGQGAREKSNRSALAL